MQLCKSHDCIGFYAMIFDIIVTAVQYDANTIIPGLPGHTEKVNNPWNIKGMAFDQWTFDLVALIKFKKFFYKYS